MFSGQRVFEAVLDIERPARRARVDSFAEFKQARREFDSVVAQYLEDNVV